MADGNFLFGVSEGNEVDEDFIYDGSDGSDGSSFDVLLQELGPDFSSLCLCSNSEETKSEEKTSEAESPSSGDLSLVAFCQKYNDIRIGSVGDGSEDHNSGEKFAVAEGSSSGDLSLAAFCEEYDDIKFGSASASAPVIVEDNSHKVESSPVLSDDYMSDFFVIPSFLGSGEEEEGWMIVGGSSLSGEYRHDDGGFDENRAHNNKTEFPYDENGLDMNGMDIEGFDLCGLNEFGFDRHGFDRDGHDGRGFDVNGVHKNGSPYDDDGCDKDGYSKRDYLLMFKDRHYDN